MKEKEGQRQKAQRQQGDPKVVEEKGGKGSQPHRSWSEADPACTRVPAHPHTSPSKEEGGGSSPQVGAQRSFMLRSQPGAETPAYSFGSGVPSTVRGDGRRA